MNNNSSKQILLSVIGVAILVVAVVGVSFAFFSYVYNSDKTNTVATGTIVFNASDTNITLTNVFPTKPSDRDYAKHSASSTVSIQGNTTYDAGIAFTVRVTDVTTSNNNILPTVTVTPDTSVEGVTFDTGYTTAKEYNPTDKLANGIISKGVIAGNTDVAMTPILTINAYYDMDDYHISDQDKSVLVGAGLLQDSYAGRVVPTDEWNALSENGNAYSFKIQVTAVENGDTDPRY